MKKMAKILLIGLGFGLVTAVLGLLTSKPTTAQLPPAPLPVVSVKVTNTPLPVQGTVNANVTNTVPVSGTVAVNSLPAISLNNNTTSPLFVRDVDNPARQPVLGACDLIQVSGPTFQSCDVHFATDVPAFSGFITIPAGYRLVIEYVSGEVDLPTGTAIPSAFGVRSSLGTAPAFSYEDVEFDPRFNGTSFGQDVYKIAQQTRIYEDPGANVILSVFVPYPVTYSAYVQITGYLVSQ